jgi:hypothetical protein
MGLFKQMKDMKTMVEAAPALVAQAQQVGAQVQAMHAANAQVMGQMGMPGGMPGPIDPADPVLAPIAGIDLARFAQISKAIGQHRLHTQEQIDDCARACGYTPEAWQAAYDGWNARFKANMALSTLYAQHYSAAQV